MDRQKNNPNGFSLIELVLVIGMMGFIMTAFASFAAHMSRDLRAANQKIEQMTMGQDIQMGLRMDTAACDLTVANQSFNSNQITGNSGPRINLPNGIVISSNGEERIAQPGELLRGTNSGLRVLTTELEITRQLQQEFFRGSFTLLWTPILWSEVFSPYPSPIFCSPTWSWSSHFEWLRPSTGRRQLRPWLGANRNPTEWRLHLYYCS